MTEICEAVAPHLMALRDNELSESDAAPVRAHLAHCAHCAAVWKAQERTLAAVAKALTLPAFADITDAVLAHVETRVTLPADNSAAALPPPRVAAILRDKNLLTREQFASFLAARQVGDVREVEAILRELGVSVTDIYAARAEADGVPFIDLNKHKPENNALWSVPELLARKHKALPVRKDGQTLFVAMVNPRNSVAVDEIRLISRCIVRPLAAVPADLDAAIDNAYSSSAAEKEPTETTRLLEEIRALRTEITALRGEMDTLRRQVAAHRNPPRPAASPRLFPGPSGPDLPGRHLSQTRKNHDAYNSYDP